MQNLTNTNHGRRNWSGQSGHGPTKLFARPTFILLDLSLFMQLCAHVREFRELAHELVWERGQCKQRIHRIVPGQARFRHPCSYNPPVWKSPTNLKLLPPGLQIQIHTMCKFFINLQKPPYINQQLAWLHQTSRALFCLTIVDFPD